MSEFEEFEFEQLGTEWQEDEEGEEEENVAIYAVKHEIGIKEEDFEQEQEDLYQEEVKSSHSVVKKRRARNSVQKTSDEDQEVINSRIKNDTVGNFYCIDCPYRGVSRSGRVSHIKVFHMRNRSGKEYRARNYIP